MVNKGEKTYAIHVPKELQKRGKPQGPDGNENITKYTDYALFENTQMTPDLYMQDIENIFFFSPNLANPDEVTMAVNHPLWKRRCTRYI